MAWQLLAGMLGIVSIALYASGQEQPRVVGAVAALVAGGSVLVGTLLGVLFGGARPGRRPDGGAPTHFEQISDWLTKILVGVALTQLTSMGEHLESLGARLAPSLGGGSAGEVVGGAIALYFSLAGFLFAYVAAASRREPLGLQPALPLPAPPVRPADDAPEPAAVPPAPSAAALEERIAMKTELITQMRSAGIEGIELARVYGERAELRVAQSRLLRDAGEVDAAAEEVATAEGDLMQAQALAPAVADALREAPWFAALEEWRGANA